MVLSSREIATPHAPAPRRYGSFSRRVSRIEASFGNGYVDEMQQWLESGVLQRLMQGAMGARTRTRPYDTIPLQLICAARDAAICGHAGLSREQFEHWWGVLMGLRTTKQPSPVTDWMTSAASLPWPQVDQWIGQGCSPMAASQSSFSHYASPFPALLADTLMLHNRPGRRPAPGWPQPARLLEDCVRRLLAWAAMPGMDPTIGEMALHRLYANALPRPAHCPQWMTQLRDTLIANAAQCNDHLMREEILPALAPHKPIGWRSSRGALRELDEQRQVREDDRVSAANRAHVMQWVDAALSNATPAKPYAWHKDAMVASAFLRSGFGVPATRRLLDLSPEMFSEDSRMAPPARFFDTTHATETTAEKLRRLRALNELSGHPGAPGRPWITSAVSQVFFRQFPTAEELSAWLDLDPSEEHQLYVAQQWVARCELASADAQPHGSASAGIALLHDRGLLLRLFGTGEEEGSKKDVEKIGGRWAGWLREESLARILRQVPDLRHRLEGLQLFFVDPMLDVPAMAALFQPAVHRSAELVGRAISFHLDRFATSGTSIKWPAAKQALQALTTLAPEVSDTAAEALWRRFGVIMSPRVDGLGPDEAVAREVAAHLMQLAPLAKANGQPFAALLEQEALLGQQTPAVRSARHGAWQAWGPLCDALQDAGGIVPEVDVAHDGALAGWLRATRLHGQLERSTPASAARMGRRRI